MADTDTEVGEGRSLREALAEVPDPRSRHGRRYSLNAILALAVCAMLSGSRSLSAMAQWGKDQGGDVARALGFERGKTPCVATLHLLFKRLDRAALERVLGAWFQEQGLKPGDALAMDGKSLRGIHGQEVPGVHLVAAYVHANGIVIDQEGVPGKGQELAAFRAVLERVPLKGVVVTGDALYAQRDICETIVKKGGPTSSP